MENKYCVITTACKTQTESKEIAKHLLEKRLVSCVQVSKKNSLYWWNGKIEDKEEYILTMKTKKKLYKDIEKEILLLHSYEIPEIVMVEINEGNRDFLEWIGKETK